MLKTELGPSLTHQFPFHSNFSDTHHETLDLCNGGHNIVATSIKKQRLSYCVGCGGEIHDQYILCVAPDLEWHAACLKCQECRQFLDENYTCFVRDGKTYCKRDYVRLFGAKCDKCGNSFSKTDFVMRAKSKIYHIDCFRCSACARQLIPGDEFALRDGLALYCKEDHDELEKSFQQHLDIKVEPPDESFQSIASNNNNNNNRSSANHSSGSMSDSGSETGSHKSHHLKSKSTSSDGKSTRVRTVLTEKQLHTLSTFFNANPRPDALMKEQLVEMTGLSPRVIRVWFQNKRCKHNKKTNQLKLQMEQEKEARKIGYGRMHGIPMIASSPVRNDSPLNMYGYEVTSYQPAWKSITDMAMYTDIENNGEFPLGSHVQEDLLNQGSSESSGSVT